MPQQCIFGCPLESGVPLHRFPTINRREQLKKWVDLVGGKLESPADYEHYKRERVCDKHFVEQDHNRNKRLGALAVPTLYLSAIPAKPQLQATVTTSSTGTTDSTPPSPTTHHAKMAVATQPCQRPAICSRRLENSETRVHRVDGRLGVPLEEEKDRAIQTPICKNIVETSKHNSKALSHTRCATETQARHVNDGNASAKISKKVKEDLVCIKRRDQIYGERKHYHTEHPYSKQAPPSLSGSPNSSEDHRSDSDSSTLNQNTVGVASLLDQNNDGDASLLDQNNDGDASLLDQNNDGDASLLDQNNDGDAILLDQNNDGDASLLDQNTTGADDDFDDQDEKTAFSWQKPVEEICDDAYARDPPDQVPSMDVEVNSYSTEQDHEMFPKDSDWALTEKKEAFREAADIYHDYKCNICSNDILSGFRYVCVQCVDLDLCAACESRGTHDQHYVLRVPHLKPHSEVSAVLHTIRRALAMDAIVDISTLTSPDVEEVKKELEDPIAKEHDMTSECNINEQQVNQSIPGNEPLDSSLITYDSQKSTIDHFDIDSENATLDIQSQGSPRLQDLIESNPDEIKINMNQSSPKPVIKSEFPHAIQDAKRKLMEEITENEITKVVDASNPSIGHMQSQYSPGLQFEPLESNPDEIEINMNQNSPKPVKKLEFPHAIQDAKRKLMEEITENGLSPDKDCLEEYSPKNRKTIRHSNSLHTVTDLQPRMPISSRFEKNCSTTKASTEDMVLPLVDITTKEAHVVLERLSIDPSSELINSTPKRKRHRVT
ncbi:zinc finger, ZZ type domain-containing protein [Phthorimaea operculella]|nr:zinc finger, ZZ type domain-containing protein [Phthorimaea operculella]